MGPIRGYDWSPWLVRIKPRNGSYVYDGFYLRKYRSIQYLKFDAIDAGMLVNSED